MKCVNQAFKVRKLICACALSTDVRTPYGKSGRKTALILNAGRTWSRVVNFKILAILRELLGVLYEIKEKRPTLRAGQSVHLSMTQYQRRNRSSDFHAIRYKSYLQNLVAQARISWMSLKWQAHTTWGRTVISTRRVLSVFLYWFWWSILRNLNKLTPRKKTSDTTEYMRGGW
jgi:hypothetical protein